MFNLIYLLNGIIMQTVGDNNISLQNIQHSTINIGTINIENLITELTKRLISNKTLYFIIAKDDNTPDWQPFGNKNILDMIKLSTKTLKDIDVLTFFINTAQTFDIENKKFFKSNAKNIILLLDTNTNLNCPLFEWLNDYHIGGCIAVPSKEKDEYNALMDILIETRHNENDLHQYKRTFKYAFKNVHSDWDIMENINNIMTAYMGLDIDVSKTIQGNFQSLNKGNMPTSSNL